jgi:hypothetical protein
MRSRPFKTALRDRLWEKRHSIHRTGRKPRRIVLFHDGKLYTGHASQHRTPEARKWRTQLRIIRQRATPSPQTGA